MWKNLRAEHRVVLKRVLLILAFSGTIFVAARIGLQFAAVANAPTVGFSFLIVVLLSAFFGDLYVAITTSIVATLCFNYFFLPPIGTFTIGAFDDWISLTAFLLTAIAISRLTSSAHENARRSSAFAAALGQLKQFGVWLLSVPQDMLTLSGIAEGVVRHFSLEYCSIHVYTEGRWHHFSGTATSETSRQIADRLGFLEDHPTNLMELVDENGLGVRYVQINQGMKPLALLVVKSKSLSADAIGTIAYMIGARLGEILHKQTLY